MLDGLLGRGFASKCKSLIKTIKYRIDVIQRKRKATQKFLKKDIADLLANGLDINAYGRAEGLLVELKLSSSYDFVEQSCDLLLKHLSIMQKQRECPENCREAVSSLMFGAARFSDLPELRELRQMFQERYENSLEHFENQKFVENLASKPSTLENKVQLMQDIALEFSIKWDCGAFEKRMSRPPVSLEGRSITPGPPTNTGNRTKPSSHKETDLRGDKHNATYKERLDVANCGNRFQNINECTVAKKNEPNFQSRAELPTNGCKALVGKEEAVLKMDGHDNSFRVRKQDVDSIMKTVPLESFSLGKRLEGVGGSMLSNGRESTVPDGKYKKFLPHERPDVILSSAGGELKDGDDNKKLSNGNSNGRNHASTSLIGNTQEDQIRQLKPHYNNSLPPPYVKSNIRRKDLKSIANSESQHTDPLMKTESNAGSEKIQSETGHSDHEMPVSIHTRVHSHGDADTLFYARVLGDPLPKPRSVRRKHSKSRSNHDVAGNVEDPEVVRRKSRSRRRDDKRGLQLLIGEEKHQKDEEERIIDKLLIHYSKKPSNIQLEKVKRKSRSHYPHDVIGETPLNGSRESADKRSEMVPPPARSVSLPREQIGPSEATKVFTRAASFQQDRLNEARHVHPKLPDYDDLATRFAALRGR